MHWPTIRSSGIVDLVMNLPDPDWAVQQLDRFLDLITTVSSHNGRPGRRHSGDSDEITEQFVAVEQIFDRVIPHWRDQPLERVMNPDLPWVNHRKPAVQAKTVILKDSEIREKLGDNAPQISAASLHPWAWEGARSLWQSGHYREAVTAGRPKDQRRNAEQVEPP
ncbi:hypothetical protein [Streptomyces sp. NPDC094468]|uniref:hypothetical protein n=1 Tax=Streptomyces sp. NPDC094468 TaxID=3366066 RepID=UPI0038224EF8